MGGADGAMTERHRPRADLVHAQQLQGDAAADDIDDGVEGADLVGQTLEPSVQADYDIALEWLGERRSTGARCFVWLPRDLEVEDPRHRAFIDLVRQAPHGIEVIESSFQKMVEVLLTDLRNPRPAAPVERARDDDCLPDLFAAGLECGARDHRLLAREPHRHSPTRLRSGATPVQRGQSWQLAEC